MTRGVVMGLLGSICNAGGATFSRPGTLGSDTLSASGCDPLEATVIRVCIAAAASIATGLATGALINTARRSFDWSTLRTYLRAVAGDLDESDCVQAVSVGDRHHPDLHHTPVRDAAPSDCLWLSDHGSRIYRGHCRACRRLSDRERIEQVKECGQGRRQLAWNPGCRL